MRRSSELLTFGESLRTSDTRTLSVSYRTRILSSFDGLTTLAMGGSLGESLPWMLLASLWLVFIAAVTALTVGEYFPIVVVPCKVAGALGILVGGLVGSLLVVQRGNSRRTAANFKTSRVSSDW